MQNLNLGSCRLFSVEFDGESPLRSKFEQKHSQTAKNGQKISCDEDAAGITSLAPGVKNLKLRNGLEFNRAY